MPIRNSAKAIIMNGEQVLLTKNHDDEQAFFYLFPGGGQEHGKTLSMLLSIFKRIKLNSILNVNWLLILIPIQYLRILIVIK